MRILSFHFRNRAPGDLERLAQKPLRRPHRVRIIFPGKKNLREPQERRRRDVSPDPVKMPHEILAGSSFEAPEIALKIRADASPDLPLHLDHLPVPLRGEKLIAQGLREDRK